MRFGVKRMLITGSTKVTPPGLLTYSSLLYCTAATRVENVVVKVHHANAPVPKSRATEEHQKYQQVNQAAKTEMLR